MIWINRDRPALAFRLLALLLAIGMAGAAAANRQIPQPRLPTVTLSAGMHKIVAEVARTAEQQAIGMMMRTEMGASEGMLFVEDYSGRRCFWMRDTLIPLSIAFVADDGRIVGLADMKPKSDQMHCSEQDVRFALEMPQGWFAKRNIKPGFQLRGAPFQP
jgi:uncharacterized membrane protein (UPF0127 family)